MKVLVTGGRGQLGFELSQRVPSGIDCVSLDRAGLDITDAQTVDASFREHDPAVVINAAAYTAVDKAEDEPERACAANRDGAGHLVRAAKATGTKLIHVSTDFVFDGTGGTPYRPGSPTNPLGVYGASKCAGEEVVREVLDGEELIVRTGWVYSAHGRNFVKTMLGLIAVRDRLAIVADQIGTPTWARDLAEALWKMARMPTAKGVLHWSDAGVVSWYDFAVAIYEEARVIGLLDGAKSVCVVPVPTDAYPTAAKRPGFSVSDKQTAWQLLAWTPVHWRVNLRAMLRELANSPNG